MIIQAIGALLALSMLVVVHEFGHFVVAKLFGVGVPVFSVGMGPRIAGFRWGETDFRLSVLPIGGYVQMAGADPFGDIDNDTWVAPEQDFMKKPVWQRLLVMFAGPAFNLIMPLFLLSFVLMRGDYMHDTVVGDVYASTPAAAAGLLPGDRVTAVDGHPVTVWADMRMALEDLEGHAVTLTVRRGDETRDVALPATAVSLTPDGYADLDAIGVSHLWVSARVGVDDPASPAGRAGLRTGDEITAVDGTPVTRWQELVPLLGPGPHTVAYKRFEAGSSEEDPGRIVRGEATIDGTGWAARPGDPYGHALGLAPVMVFVGSYTTDSAAAEAGLQPDDRIFAVDGEPVRAWNDLLRLVKRTAPPDETATSGGCLGAKAALPDPRPLTLTVVRDGALLDLTFVPKLTRELVRATVSYRPLIGIERYPDAFVAGTDVMKKYTLREAVPQSVEDVITVMSGTLEVLGQWVTRERKLKETVGGPIAIVQMTGQSAGMGLNAFIRMVATISVGLGLINLLPVPVLDGGQILFYAIEGIRGRPLPLALREKVQMVGVLFLVALILVVSVNDVGRLISGG